MAFVANLLQIVGEQARDPGWKYIGIPPGKKGLVGIRYGYWY